jgi:hypothetical protein
MEKCTRLFPLAARNSRFSRTASSSRARELHASFSFQLDNNYFFHLVVRWAKGINPWREREIHDGQMFRRAE